MALQEICCDSDDDDQYLCNVSFILMHPQNEVGFLCVFQPFIHLCHVRFKIKILAIFTNATTWCFGMKQQREILLFLVNHKLLLSDN